MRLDSLKPSQHKKGRFLAKLEDGTVLRLGEEELLRFHLRVGDDLDEELLAALKKSVETSKTRERAANIIGSRPLSKSELQKRLVQKGSAPEDAADAADWLEDLGAVDDEAYAALLVQHYSARGYGSARIREELRRRGVHRELWDEALSKREDSAETLDALIRKKCKGDLADPRERKRVADFLMRRGFSWGEVRAAIGRYTEILEDDSL